MEGWLSGATLLHDLLAPLGAVTAAPYYLARSIARPEYRAHLGERFGRYPSALLDALGGLTRPPVWIQAVSVGEVMVARTLIDRLRRAGGTIPFVVSSTTPSGRRLAVESLGRETAGIFHFPLDWRPIVRRTLRAVRPAAFISIETELWPGLLTECGEAGLPVAVVNGRISPRSRDRYARLSWLMRRPLLSIRLACMQTAEDADRLESLGLPRERIVVTGNMKFDAARPSGSRQDARNLFGLSLDADRPVLVAGSTSPGEEQTILEAVRLADLPDLVLVLAPRHPERFEEVAGLLASRGIRFARRSRPSPGSPGPATVLLDTLGELKTAYGLATVAFVGGSLVPRGGQNLLEPAAWGVPVLFGPHTENFTAIARSLIDAGAGFRVRDAADLATQLRRLCSDTAARGRAGAAGRALVEENRGATDRTIDHVLPLIG